MSLFLNRVRFGRSSFFVNLFIYIMYLLFLHLYVDSVDDAIEAKFISNETQCFGDSEHVSSLLTPPYFRAFAWINVSVQLCRSRSLGCSNSSHLYIATSPYFSL